MACTTTLGTIQTSCGANLSSIKKLWIGGFESATFTYSYQEDAGPDGEDVIESVTAATLNTTPTAADPWVEFAFRKNTGEMTVEMTRNDSGSYYFTNSANLVFAKQDQSKRLALQAVASGECTMIVLDNNGIYWLIGAENAVSASTLSATTGVAVGDSNQYTVTLSADEAYMPIPLDAEQAGAIVAGLTGVSE